MVKSATALDNLKTAQHAKTSYDVASGLVGTRQSRDEERKLAEKADAILELLGLSDTEAKLLPHLPRGQALWKVGSRSFLVEHRLSVSELALVDTDARMRSVAVPLGV